MLLIECRVNSDCPLAHSACQNGKCYGKFDDNRPIKVNSQGTNILKLS